MERELAAANARLRALEASGADLQRSSREKVEAATVAATAQRTAAEERAAKLEQELRQYNEKIAQVVCEKDMDMIRKE